MIGLHRGDDKPRICFVSHDAYGAISGGDFGGIGGVARQTSLMARWFAGRGYPVSMLTWDEGQEDGEVIDGVHIFTTCREDAGIPGARFFVPRWSSLIAGLRRADADIYYHNCMGYETGQVALWCRKHGRKFIYSVASDVDCHAKYPRRKRFQDRVLFRYGLKHADKIIAQTRRQQRLLFANHGLDSLVLPMPCPSTSEADTNMIREAGHRDTDRVLWIARLCGVKRPDRLLDLAEACPDLWFDFVGPAGDTDYGRRMVDRAKTIPNIVVHGAVPRRQIPSLYRKAGVLCCTSDYEGFPNTFLEAWSHGLPVVSTFDPDNLIAEHGLGLVATDVSGLAHGIRQLLSSTQLRREASQAALQYYQDNHTMESAMPRFEEAFLSVLEGAKSQGPVGKTQVSAWS